jgi:hypothetical protein
MLQLVNFRERAPGIHWIGGSVDPIFDFNTVENTKFSYPARN